MRLKTPNLTALTLFGCFYKEGISLNGSPWKLLIIKFIDHVGTPHELKDFVDATKVRTNSRMHKSLINLGCYSTDLKAVEKFIKDRVGLIYIGQIGIDSYKKRIVLPNVRLITLDDIAA